MKKIFTLISLLFLTIAVNAQLLVDDFNYSGALTANGWTAHSGTGTNPPSTTTGLTYTGYANSGIGNAALIGNAGGEDVHKLLASEVTGDGTTVYYSFMVNVTEAASNKTGDYFIHIGDKDQVAGTFTIFAARVFVRVVADVVNFGVSNTSTATWGTTAFAKNTTYLVVVKYTTSAAGNDPVSLWVFPSGVPATEAAAGTPELTVTTTAGPTSNTIDAIALRQGSSTTQPQTVVDGLRVSTGWFNAPLPINLLSFSASLNNTAVNVGWSTTNETNVAAFAIEKSINGKDFKSIGTVEAKGGIATNNYSFTDEKLVAGVSYYRLKMIDKDGSSKYSAIETVKTKSVGLSVYPNPVKNTITVQHEIAAKGAMVSVMTVAGKPVFQSAVDPGATQTSIDAAKLAPGAYLVMFINNGVKLTKQFIKE